jgi:FKBP-type peptidyl-prolyl cis-trans isomerase
MIPTDSSSMKTPSLLLCGMILSATSLTSQETAVPTEAPAAEAPAAEAKPAVEAPAATPGLTTLDEKASYIIGTNIGGNLKQLGTHFQREAFLKGLEEAMASKKSALTEAQIQETMGEFQKVMMEEEQKQMAEKGKKNVEEGAAFLKTNGSREGVTTTASGLQYEVMKAGEGAKPKASDEVTVHYHGTLIDGTVFDSSVDRGQPATFPLGGVIPGWTEALQLMPVGSKYKIFLPSALAYGERGSPPDIGPNSVLVFEVELLKIGAAEAAPVPQ